jgi:hypothetical protein
LIDALAAGENAATVRVFNSPKEYAMNDDVGRLGLLYRLSDSDRMAVCQEIAESCERAFRRGFAQGVEAGHDAVVNIEDWRFRVPLAESPSPHGTYDCDAITRHAFEAGLPINAIHAER